MARWNLAIPLLLVVAALLAAATDQPGTIPAGCGLRPGEQGAGQLVPPAARAVLQMSAVGITNWTCGSGEYFKVKGGYSPEQTFAGGGSYGNLTGQGYAGFFMVVPRGDVRILLWPSGAPDDQWLPGQRWLALLTMPSVEEFNTSASAEPDQRFGVTGYTTGTAGSYQAKLPLPPIWLVVRSNISRAGPKPQGPCTPATDPPIVIPWTSNFTFYTCVEGAREGAGDGA